MQHPVPEVYARVKIFRLLAIRYPGGGGIQPLTSLPSMRIIHVLPLLAKRSLQPFLGCL